MRSKPSKNRAISAALRGTYWTPPPFPAACTAAASSGSKSTVICDREAATGRQRLREGPDEGVRAVLFREEVQDRDEHQRDWPAQVEGPRGMNAMAPAGLPP
jgi:hypothetical protein